MRLLYCQQNANSRRNYFLLKPSRLNTLDGAAGFDFLPLAVSIEFFPRRDESETRPMRLTNLLTSGRLAASAPISDSRLLTGFAIWSDLRPAVLIGEPLARFTGCFNLITFCVRCNAVRLGDELCCFVCDDTKPSRARILLFLFDRFLFGLTGGCRDSISRISSSVENDTVFSPVSIRSDSTYSSAIIVAALAGIFFTKITFCLATTFFTPSSCNGIQTFWLNDTEMELWLVATHLLRCTFENARKSSINFLLCLAFAAQAREYWRRDGFSGRAGCHLNGLVRTLFPFKTIEDSLFFCYVDHCMRMGSVEYILPSNGQLPGHLRDAFFAKICLLRSVVPDGNFTLYLPSCSGRTRLAGFAGGPSDIMLDVWFETVLRTVGAGGTKGLTDSVATDCFSPASTLSRAFCSLTFLACLQKNDAHL